ncbi:cutinase [Mycolicibacterium llatzerense]|nr:cutinase family protein [Mycolicibacterium llatzerense]MCT7363686.1 cutinase [Mycolicibacterium llatzerense]MCT7367842.1 cutinase [Mycolicibacterium llatzerense]
MAGVTVLAPPSLGAVGVAAAANCPDIEVTFARGTTEAPGLGKVGGAFVNQLRNKVGGRSVGSYAVVYPASYDFLAAADGANDASAHIQWMADNCPGTRQVLGGYSQGAAVMDVIGAIPVPGVGFNNPLPPEAAGHVAAIAVFGNPSAKLGLPLTASPVWGGKVIDLCNPGDPICQTDGQVVDAHKTYAGGATNDAANFVAGLL